MKNLLITLFGLLSTPAFAHEIIDQIGVVAQDSAVKVAVSEVIKARTESDMRWFKGIVMSNLQTGCTGDRTYFDLLFTRITEDTSHNSISQRCRIIVTYGTCGEDSGKVESVNKNLICE